MSKVMQLKARIKNLATQNHIPAQAVLQNFMLEHLLERISLSNFKEVFILKGGMLIAALVGMHNRTTMDMDATMREFALSEDTIQLMFSEICTSQSNDGINFELTHISPIRDEDEYGGYRVALLARFETVTTPLKIDLTTGDIITPAAVPFSFHSNFENRMIEVWAYNIETILAEKVETILRRSVLNTRLRDFYDVYILMKTQRHAIHTKILAAALHATCKKRMSLTALHEKGKIILTIKSDAVMRQRWERYCNVYYFAKGVSFDEVIGNILEVAA
jgi:predicted nucleotidyltransferase component of viral defense system